ncbi:hypothetical protein E2C01_027668 [Portunus trituberculatus]|uniref:Uncharacterized protein n=1 Tax=Portunus trituberculatus TaxID=210409 RepID=A0A5B7EPG8_PORTR|nr:hypothetical protein [Portunus trituberculatus]
MAGYPVESRVLLLCSEALEATQDGSDESGIVTGMQLLEDLKPGPVVSVQHHGGLLALRGSWSRAATRDGDFWWGWLCGDAVVAHLVVGLFWMPLWRLELLLSPVEGSGQS